MKLLFYCFFFPVLGIMFTGGLIWMFLDEHSACWKTEIPEPPELDDECDREPEDDGIHPEEGWRERCRRDDEVLRNHGDAEDVK